MVDVEGVVTFSFGFEVGVDEVVAPTALSVLVGIENPPVSLVGAPRFWFGEGKRRGM